MRILIIAVVSLAIIGFTNAREISRVLNGYGTYGKDGNQYGGYDVKYGGGYESSKYPMPYKHDYGYENNRYPQTYEKQYTSYYPSNDYYPSNEKKYDYYPTNEKK